MSTRQVAIAWLFHSACCGVTLLATPARAQMKAGWQATTMSTWASDGLCATSRGVGEPLTSSQSIGGGLTFGERRGATAAVTGTGTMGAGQALCSQRWSALVSAQASYQRHDTRFWVAYSESNARNADTTVRQPGLVAGVERRIGPTTLAMSVGPRRDRTAMQYVVQSKPHLSPEVIFPVGGAAVQETVYVADTVTRFGRASIPDLRFGLSWTGKALGVEAGAHFGLAGATQRLDPLGTLRVTYDVSAHVSAIAAVTSRAALPVRDLPATQVVTLGLRIGGGDRASRESSGRWAATATEFRVARDTADRLTIIIKAPHAERVEIAADFTRWTPVNLERLAGGWWQLRVSTQSGIHRVSVRVDGRRWNAPPGLPPVHDEFGGTVGMVVVE